MKRKPVTIIILVVLGLLILSGLVVGYFYLRPPTQQELDNYSQAIEEGDLFYESREYTQAIKKYNGAVKILHREKDAYSRLVQIFLDKNDFDSANDIVKKGVNNLSPEDSASLYAQLATSYYNIDDYDNAKKYFELANSLSNEYDIVIGLARVYLQTGNINGARELVKGKDGDEANLLYIYILSLQDVNQSASHLGSYSPSEDWAIYFEEIVSVIDSFDENELFNNTKLARIFVNNGYPYLAISVLEKYDDGSLDQYVDALYILGKAKLDNQDYEGAIQTLSSATVLIGYERDKYWMLARAYYLSKDLVNASLNYDRAISYAGENLSGNLVSEYLNMLLESNQTTKAESVLGDVVGDIAQPWIYILAQEVYYKTKNMPKFEYYTDLLSKEDLTENEEQEYLFWSIRYDLDENSTEGLDDRLEILFNLNRLNPKYYWLKGILYSKSNMMDEAEDSWEKALEYDLSGDITYEIEKLLSRV